MAHLPLRDVKGRDLSDKNSVILLCDFQESFRPVGYKFAQCLDVAKRMIEASKLLSIPLIVTEQYPKGLGKTCPELSIEHASGTYEKTVFTMLTPEVESKLKELKKPCAVLLGLEAHVCVLQTALDLLHLGLEVYLIADACTSRSSVDRLYALERLKQAGCVITTYEACLLQFIRGKDHPQFKAVQAVIKTQPEETGLLGGKL